MHYLTQGRDFNCQVKSFQVLCHRAAHSERYGGAVDTQIDPRDPNTVKVKFRNG